MKTIFKSFTVIAAALMLASCVDLNLNPLSEGSSSNWFSSAEEFEMTTADFYREEFFPLMMAFYGDDLSNRNSVPMVAAGTVTADHDNIITWWTNLYKAITRSQRVIANLQKGADLGIQQSKLDQYEGEAFFCMGFAYGYLAFHWGDVPLYKTPITLEESFSLERSPKEDVVAFSLECFDKAIEKLPVSYTGQQRATKGAALALKARIALYHGKYAEAADAAKKCMDLGIYSLEPEYEDMFTTSFSNEWIFWFPASIQLEQYYFYYDNIKKGTTRCSGGFGQMGISYELLCAYLCTDGKPIDESPLYNPKDFFENRDPRLSKTIVPFATAYNKDVLAGKYNPDDYAYLGYEYTPDPHRYQCKQMSTGKMVTNLDSKAGNQHACYNGLMVKKFVDETWLENAMKGTATPQVYCRYGDVLLMYAEAMIEQNKCTQEVLDLTINKLRERAYAGTGLAYPKLILGSQAKMRTELRTERFVEMALEKLRVEDLYRWKLAEVVFNRPMYWLDRAWSGSASWKGDESAVSDAYKVLLKNWDEGNYPIGGIPQIDENGLADVSYMVDAGYIQVAVERHFDEKDYLWPIPAAERLVNPKLTQNPGW